MADFLDGLNPETKGYDKRLGATPMSAADRIASKILSLGEPTFN
jgi:hypothetical protein